ncbi:MAG: tetratricopeptide repeat protein [Tsuneonella suprasediminis]|nr:sel1 repeat family protein [Altererythrobacter sp. N1]
MKKNTPIAALALLMAALIAGPASAQANPNSPAERACKARYDDISRNLNSTRPDKRRVSDEEIGWALRYEQVNKAGKPCSEADQSPQQATASAKPEAQAVRMVEAGGTGNAMEGQKAYNSGDFATARTKYRAGCMTDGNAAACTNLGAMARTGKGGAKDLPLARSAYQRGCAKGMAEACENYGSMLKNGVGGPKDFAGAIAPLTTACNAKMATSCYDLGTSYFYGRVGNGPDYARARQYLAKACPGYAADGCYALAILQRDGKGGAVDLAGAAKAFALSCEAGKSDGCLEYGVAQYGGAGIRIDMAGARSSFGKACNTGNAGACMNAAIMSREGQGGARDPAAAKRYFNLGCKLGIQEGCKLAGQVGA